MGTVGQPIASSSATTPCHQPRSGSVCIVLAATGGVVRRQRSRSHTVVTCQQLPGEGWAGYIPLQPDPGTA